MRVMVVLPNSNSASFSPVHIGYDELILVPFALHSDGFNDITRHKTRARIPTRK